METTLLGSTFVQEIAATPGGEGIKVCIQCGTCTASCPNVGKMEYTPSQLIAMARAGMRDEVLSSNSMWYCLSCYLCTVRCPRGVKQTELMHALEALALREGVYQRRTLTPMMYRSFNHFACTLGNLPEFAFMAWFYTLTNPLRSWRMLPVAYNLYRRGRLSIKARRLSPAAAKQLGAIMDKAQSFGGAI